jgi:hypothetical protein
MRSIQFKCGLCLLFTLWLPVCGEASEATRLPGPRSRLARSASPRNTNLLDPDGGHVWHDTLTAFDAQPLALAPAQAPMATLAPAGFISRPALLRAASFLYVHAPRGRAPPPRSL